MDPTTFRLKQGAASNTYNIPLAQPTGIGKRVSFSPTGSQLVLVHDSYPYCTAYTWSAGSFVAKLSDPATVIDSASSNSLGTALSISPSGNQIVVSTNNSCKRYNWSATGFGSTLSIPAAHGTGVSDAIFSNSGSHLAIFDGASPYIYVYPMTGTSMGAKVADPAVVPFPSSAGSRVAFSPADDYIAFTTNPSPYVSVYPWNGSFGAKVADPATISSSGPNGIVFSPDGLYLAYTTTTSPYIHVYNWNGSFGAKVSNPATLPATLAYSVKFSKAGDFIAISSDSLPGLSVYSWNSGVFGARITPTSSAHSGRDLDFSPTGSHIAVATSSSPYLFVYPFNGTTLPTRIIPI